MADAQKAYVKGDWKTAAQAFEMACPKEPKEKQDECFLWNILALSQIGDAKSFKVAGKKLDSLIANTNPQKDIYADLLMTSAQFRMYLGKYDKAAEDLVRAIENSKPKHATVLLKVCDAIRAKSNLQNLVERCEELKNPEAKPPVKATEDSSKNAAIIRGKSAEAVALNAPQKTDRKSVV